MSVRDLIYMKTQKSLHDEDGGRVISLMNENKPITLRLDKHVINAIDLIAKKIGSSRQSFLDDIIYEGINEAISGYSEAHGPQYQDDVKNQFFEELDEMNSNLSFAEDSES